MDFRCWVSSRHSVAAVVAAYAGAAGAFAAVASDAEFDVVLLVEDCLPCSGVFAVQETSAGVFVDSDVTRHVRSVMDQIHLLEVLHLASFPS